MSLVTKPRISLQQYWARVYTPWNMDTYTISNQNKGRYGMERLYFGNYGGYPSYGYHHIPLVMAINKIK